MAYSINEGTINPEQGSLTKSTQKVGTRHCDIQSIKNKAPEKY